MFSWIRQHKFETHLSIFLLMIFASIGLYTALVREMNYLYLPLLAVFILSNLIAMVVK